VGRRHDAFNIGESGAPPEPRLHHAPPEAPTRPSDRALIDAINRGEVDAFEELYRRYRDRIVRLAYRFTGNRDDAPVS